MSETENKKPRISKLAVVSFLLVVFGFSALIFLWFFRRGGYTENAAALASLAVGLPIAAGIALGVVSFNRFKKTKDTLRGQVFSISSLIIGVIAIFVITSVQPSRRPSRRIICANNERILSVAVFFYAQDHNNTYPPADRWCDLLIQNNYVSKKHFICPSAYHNGDKGQCHYAINPACEPNSPADTVLIFETKGGWNQYGGPELLKFGNHSEKRCLVSFKDSHVEIIKEQDAGKLIWKAEDVNSVK